MFARRPYIVAGSLIILKKKKTTNSDLVLFVSHLVAIKIVSCLSISFKILDRSKSTVLSNINQYQLRPLSFHHPAFQNLSHFKPHKAFDNVCLDCLLTK